jgi:hypothetical protein
MTSQLTRIVTLALAAAGLILVASQADAGNRHHHPAAVDTSNRMDLTELYAIHGADTQSQVEGVCSCSGTVVSTFDAPAPGGNILVAHKRVAYPDAADHGFQVVYYMGDNAWREESKSIVADGSALPFKSDRDLG